MLTTLRDELHLHLYGCLTAADLFELGRDRHTQPALSARLDWYADEYLKAWGRRPDWRAYWSRSSGAELLRQDFEMLTAEPFARFQACFNLAIALFPAAAGDTTVLSHVLRQHQAQGLRHVEYRCFLPPVLPVADIPRYVTALAAAAARAEAAAGGTFQPRLAFSCSRDPALFARQYAALKAAQRQPQHGATVSRLVTGIDLCGIEEGHPPRHMRATFAGVHADNRQDPATALALLYHVGESWHDKGLASAVRWVSEAQDLGVHRLGHAVALGLGAVPLLEDRQERGARESVHERRDHLRWLLERQQRLRDLGYELDRAAVSRELTHLQTLPDTASVDLVYDAAALADIQRLQDAVLRDLAARGAVIESCLTSNLRIGRLGRPEHHPLRRFIDAGVRVVLASDDPGTFATDLGREEALARSLGVNDDAMGRLAETAVAARSANLVHRPQAD